MLATEFVWVPYFLSYAQMEDVAKVSGSLVFEEPSQTATPRIPPMKGLFSQAYRRTSPKLHAPLFIPEVRSTSWPRLIRYAY